MKLASTLLFLPSLGFAKIDGMAKRKLQLQLKTQLKLTVTNLSYQQPFSSFFVMTHNSSAPPLYTMGTAASDELAILAENGDPSELVGLYNGTTGVCSVSTTPGPLSGNVADPIMEIMVTVSDLCPLVTIASMALNTNDCFVAINGEELEEGDVRDYPGLDAGSEENNELCSSIPGPGCPADSGNNADGNGEGFIHVHRGFFGIGGELSEAGYDWRNGMMRVAVSRSRPKEDKNAAKAVAKGPAKPGKAGKKAAKRGSD